MTKQFMPLALVSLLVCSLLCTSAFAADRDTQTEPAVIEVDTAALFSTIESNEAQMVNVLEKQAGAVVVAPEFSHFSDVATSNALQAGGDVEQTDYVPGTESHEDGIDPESSGELAAGKSWSYDAQSMSKGQKITISVDYTPTSSNMQIGLKDSNGTVYYTTVTGGSGSATFSINKTGTYSIYVGNPSSVSVNFDVSYILD